MGSIYKCLSGVPVWRANDNCSVSSSNIGARCPASAAWSRHVGGREMPLTKTGAKVKASMTKQYGAEKGERVFYASINKGKPGSRSWHKSRSLSKGRH